LLFLPAAPAAIQINSLTEAEAASESLFKFLWQRRLDKDGQKTSEALHIINVKYTKAIFFALYPLLLLLSQSLSTNQRLLLNRIVVAY